MNNDQSLSSFFNNVEITTLDNCDREKIHLSNAIQPVGALLVLDPEDFRILAASENAGAFLGLESAELTGRSLLELDGELARQIACLEADPVVLYDVLDYGLEYQGLSYDVVTHLHDDRRLIEFVPNNQPSPLATRKAMRHCTNSCARILSASSFEDAMQIATAAVQQISNFGRVKIYRFLPDWSGEVAAESIAGTMSSYLGLHFPERDIPLQVRSVMSIIPCRAIGTTDDKAIPLRLAPEVDGHSLDLTWSILRSVSTMHTAYLRNMGVQASFSCSLMYQGKLWGLIAAHHDEAGLIAFDNWGLIQEISTTLMLRYDQYRRKEVTDMITRLRVIENEFAFALRKSGDLEEVIRKLVPVLQEFLGADGFAFQYGANLYVSGSTPPQNFIRDLIQWAIKKRASEDQYQTTQLHKEWPPAIAHMDTACGVLIQPIVVHRVCQLLWFRGPISKNVDWAGKPDDKSTTRSDDPLSVLQPRNSFERWTTEHCDQSAAWRESEMESAKEIFKEFLDIIAAQLLLKEENASLKSFAALAAHDIKAPLRRIHMALDIMHEENFVGDLSKQTHAMAMKSAKRLESLTTALLELSVISEQKVCRDTVDLNLLVAEVLEMLLTEITEAEARVVVDPLPTILADESLLIRLFLNLISNAIKYRDPERIPEIRIESSQSAENTTLLTVTDNGKGIEAQYAQKIFNPMVRLVANEDVDGTGLGLAICQRVVDVHSGAIWLDEDYRSGARFVVTLPAAAS